MAAEIHKLVTRKSISSAKELLQSLVPRAQCFYFYNLNHVCVWSSDGSDDQEINEFVAAIPDNILSGADSEASDLRHTLESGRTLLVLPMHTADQENLGVLISEFSKKVGKSSWFNPSLLKSILLPAVQVIGDTLRLNHEVERAGARAAIAEKELKLIYQVDEKIHGASRSHSGLAQLIGQSGRFMEIAYSVLLLPSKRIRISATHSTWKNVNRKQVDKYLFDTLFSKLDAQRTPAVFEIPPVEGSDNPADKGYQAMLCSLIDSNGRVEGALAYLGRVDGSPFSDSHRRFMTHIVRKVEYVIEQSFDAMTGLMNRTGFEAQLRESKRALADSDDTHQLIHFDMDNLQLVNDTFGRAAGDELIIRFARLIEEHLPKNAVASHLAGDVFAILMTLSSLEDAMELTARIRAYSQALRYLQGDKSLQTTVSAGISAMQSSGSETDTLTEARIACESAKDHGRDRIEVYDQANQSIIQRHDDISLVGEIQKSLESDGFTLVAQPIISLANDDQIVSYEILLRMQGKDGNPVASEAFFSAAERFQLMPQIDRWVISNTLMHLSTHVDFLRDSGIIFAINLSGQSLGDDDILSFVEMEIDRCGLPAELLRFEVTESAAVSSEKKAQAFINTLRARGCKFSLDDFGVGLSSFAYLKNFRVDTLKIDGGFIRDIIENRISESMVAAITQVAKVMELETVAEYVETDEAKELVARLGVDYAQGYAIGMPEPLDNVLAGFTAQPKLSTA